MIFMPENSYICNKCGQRIIGNLFKRYNSKSYCIGCYSVLIQEATKQERDKQKLYKYIKELFVLPDCPAEVVNMIDSFLKDGKKPSGIEATLWYYYEILGNKADISFIGKTIREQYENAKKYVIEQQQIKKYNETVNLNVAPRTIKISSSSLNNTNFSKKTSYNMEDL